MRARTVAAVLLIALFAISFELSAQSAESSLLTLERIFSSREFASERFGPARWLEDGSGYTTVEPSATVDGGDDIVRYDDDFGRK